MIQATITGRLGADPEKKTTSSGKDFVSLRVASSNRRDGATWVRCTVWREKLAEFVIKNCRKGARVAVAGSLEEQTWGDNAENKALELDCAHLELYDWPEEQASKAAPAPKAAPKKAAPTSTDLPF